MTEHNAISYYPELSKGIAAGMGLDVTAEGLTRLGESLQVIVDPFRQPWLRLVGVTPLIGRTDVPAGGAGFHSQVAIQAVANQRIVTHVKGFQFGREPGVATDMNIGLVRGLSGFSSTGNLVARDTRGPITAGGAIPLGCRMLTKNDAAGVAFATNLITFTLLPQSAGYPPFVELDLTLTPPWAVILRPSATNVALNDVNFYIDEYRSFPGDPAVSG